MAHTCGSKQQLRDAGLATAPQGLHKHPRYIPHILHLAKGHLPYGHCLRLDLTHPITVGQALHPSLPAPLCGSLQLSPGQMPRGRGAPGCGGPPALSQPLELPLGAALRAPVAPPLCCRPHCGRLGPLPSATALLWDAGCRGDPPTAQPGAAGGSGAAGEAG